MSNEFKRFFKGIVIAGETSDLTDNVEGSIWHNSTDNRIRTYINASTKEFTTNDESQTLTNKLLDDATTEFQDNFDSTKRLKFQLGGQTTGVTTTISVQTATSGTLFLPAYASGDQFALRDLAQTLTNKDFGTGNTTTFQDTTNSTSTGTGSVVISGGLGIASDMVMGGDLDVQATTTSTLPTNGAITTAGGAGIAENLNVGGNVIITGDLTVNGTTTTVDTDNLAVEDNNITINNGGTVGTANGAGLTVDRGVSTAGSLIFDTSFTGSNWGLGLSGSEVEIADVSTAQTLTNKTITAAGNSISGLTHGSEVDNPSSGVHGVTGDVVGTSDAQTITAKDIDGGTASNTSRFTAPKADKAGVLDGLTRKEGTILFDSTGKDLYFDDGTSLIELAAKSNPNVASKVFGDSPYTALTTDDIILYDTSGGASTIDLFTAVGNTGKILEIKKTDSSLNAVTIDGFGAQTIDGTTTTTLNTQYETLKIISDGTNWNILTRTIPSNWIAYTPSTAGLGAPSNINFESRRDGNDLLIQGRLTIGAVTATEARINLGFAGGDGNVTTDSFGSLKVAGYATIDATNDFHYTVLLESSVSYITFGLQASGGLALTKQNGSGIFNNGETLAFFIRAPISGWNS